MDIILIFGILLTTTADYRNLTPEALTINSTAIYCKIRVRLLLKSSSLPQQFSKIYELHTLDIHLPHFENIKIPKSVT